MGRDPLLRDPAGDRVDRDRLVRGLRHRPTLQGAELSGGAHDLPGQLQPVAWLIGRWIGVGTGQYPTIEDFRFGQELQFSCDGRPFLTYWSRTWLLDSDGNRVRPTAMETGFVRCNPDYSIELLLTHPTGFVELWEGKVEITAMSASSVTGARLELRTDLVARTDNAKPYTAGHRLYGLVNGELLWTFDMAAMGLPLQNHIAARLQPVSGAPGDPEPDEAVGTDAPGRETSVAAEPPADPGAGPA